MKKSLLLILSALCPFFYGLSVSSSHGGNEKEGTIPSSCNWGWHGDCNDYFTSGVFKTRQAVISDGFGQGMNKN